MNVVQQQGRPLIAVGPSHLRIYQDTIAVRRQPFYSVLFFAVNIRACINAYGSEGVPDVHARAAAVRVGGAKSTEIRFRNFYQRVSPA